MAPLEEDSNYKLDEQVGFALRKAYQRHMTIFSGHNPGGLTSMQFSTLYRLATEPGPISQNALGRLVAMDAATTKGVISRLQARGLVETERDKVDKRRYMLRTTPEGRALLAEMLPTMKQITADTLAPLDAAEAETLLSLLRRIS
ncbi:MarR family winged helix-turn-helix transcriptional regulator [Mangrovicoccus algicola]|uniref:MarR family transcriptional regulator n=1 Tax=Mangrovicoccus algicola TaxID=2771008 RepID=A0A8J7CW65_9RHOB|nr:MarR family transcriptional regulator [Mangrovicoccus algicola]MBE3639584.1 MarR family transcriptional regulator [Mangrovicoccus algicola]